MSHRTIDLLAGIGPTLRCPLNQIISVSEILREGIAGDLNEQQMTRLASLSATSGELLGVVRDLIDLARIESGATRVEPSQCDVAPSIHAAVAAVRPLAFTKQVMLATFSDERSALTTADPNWLERLFAAVVSSAVAIAKGQSMVTVNLHPCEHNAAHDAELRVTICVHESTLSVPPRNEAHHIEELVTECERHAHGVGLRLALAHAIARQYGGRVSVVSGGGAPPSARFAVALQACALAPA